MSQAPHPDPPVVVTTHGPVRGAWQGSVRFFGGIPFAAPPTGRARFAAPTAPAPWSQPFDASGPAAAAPHEVSDLGRAIGLATDFQSEDCLTVTVWSPEPVAARGAMPVMVWIHGGGFEGGSAGNPVACGRGLAERGGVVVVSVQYRLGLLGFMHLEGAPDNRGLLDQIAALRWVRDNVARFGGDPERVTVFGSSAGGVSIAMLLAMPEAKGLFSQAVIQSGNAECIHSMNAARDVEADVLAVFGFAKEARPADVLAALTDMDIRTLVATQHKASAALGARYAGIVFQPVLDGESIPEHPLAAVRRGSANGVRLFLGTNRDEMKLAALATFDFGDFDETELRRRCRDLLAMPEGEPLVDRVVLAYRTMPDHRDRRIRDVWDALSTDFHFRYPLMRLADAHALAGGVTFVYEVTFASRAFDGALGAAHAIEIPLLFGTYEEPAMEMFLSETPGLEEASRLLQEVWLSFASTGAPAAPGASREAWPLYRREARAVIELSSGLTSKRDAFVEEHSVWEPVFADIRFVTGFDPPRSRVEIASSSPPPRRPTSLLPLRV